MNELLHDGLLDIAKAINKHNTVIKRGLSIDFSKFKPEDTVLSEIDNFLVLKIEDLYHSLIERVNFDNHRERKFYGANYDDELCNICTIIRDEPNCNSCMITSCKRCKNRYVVNEESIPACRYCDNMSNYRK